MDRTRARRLYRAIVVAGMAVPSACGSSEETQPPPPADTRTDTSDASSPADTASDTSNPDTATPADTTSAPDTAVTDTGECTECWSGDACLPCIK